jgi:hypothetical protein
MNVLIYILKEESQNLTRFIKCYDYIINNDVLKTLLNLILKIHNFLNKSSGKKEEKNFDIRNIPNILNLKNNNKQFMEILIKLYFANTEKTISRSDLHLLHNLTESDKLPLSESDYTKHQNLLDSTKETIMNLSLNKGFVSHLNSLFNDINLTLANIKSDIETENKHRKQFLEYLSYSAESAKPEIINSILSNCYTLLSKIATTPKPQIAAPKQTTPPTQKKIAHKENSHRASNLINKYNLI